MAGTITEFFGYRETHGHRAKRYGHIAFLAVRVECDMVGMPHAALAGEVVDIVHSSPRQEAAPFQPHDEITVFIDERSTWFRLACRGDGARSRLAHESTFAGPT